jgi:D-alanyl-D-alanine carboxypeptidase (penicillin-binding protein 5/6)
LVDARSGHVLYSRNADQRRYPASLTKVMTLYLAFDAISKGRLKLSDPVVVSPHAASRPPSRMGLRPGSRITVAQAIDLIVVKSANDVAVALAEKIGGTEAKFAQKMTRQAKRLGMTRTRFANASGLPDTRQVTTARDMAVLAKAIRRDFPKMYPRFNQQQTSYRGRTVHGHNAILRVRGVDGLKTGYTHASGFNLVTSARRGDDRLIGVVMGGSTASSRDAYMRRLIDAGFQTSAAAAGKLSVASLMGAPTMDRTPVRFEVAQGDDDATEDGWRIQVGAFRIRQAAQARLDMLGGDPSLLAGDPTPQLRRVGHFYLARFTGLSAADARSGCQLIQAAGGDCLVMAPTAK